ncbi:MAG: type II toxin-antitoxin system VapC family toxin [Chromatiaceae bacterium]|nr:type II toxin-antitoxin system VapC family toxin [Chromatiaceae bacterium]MBP6808881.1 type II toxin-antitoxin system VapC family toxin [Chromatiaceae bacterium]MBP8285098.1 type II toxin-antitoxin system VapC family toxin [Chromatiaceae bacterium]
MILFCDTSALIKLYIREDFTDRMLAAAEAASATAVCRIAWAEAMAALARRSRECPADTGAIDTARRRLRKDWSDYAIIEVTQALVELAGDYADTFALRGYDSVQLAAARTLYEAGREPVQFACFDRRLQIAARLLGLESVLLPDLPG